MVERPPSPARAAANRRNAARSTGPRTPAGKSKAAGNALRHGLSRPAATLPEFVHAVQKLAARFDAAAGAAAGTDAVLIAAEAQIDLKRVRTRRRELLSRLEHVVDHPGPEPDMLELAEGVIEEIELSDAEPAFRMSKRHRAKGLKLLPLLLVDRTPRERARLLRELDGLERYERRALSRRDGALRRLVEARAADPDVA